jgi:KipI family sensor histidine kinase inhibitor
VITIRRAGDAGLILEPEASDSGARDGNEAARLAAAITAAALPGVTDVVPGCATVLVRFEPGAAESAVVLAAHLRHLAAGPLPDLSGPADEAVVIDAVYDGPDLAEVAELTGLSVDEVISRHQAAEYRVGWLGFSPGFGYLTGLDPLLAAVPRLDSPRPSVPAGSVAIAGGLAAVYPAASPGGWRLLGRTDLVLWDTGRDPPALLAPGRRVRFRAARPETALSPATVSPATPAPASAPAQTPAPAAGARRAAPAAAPAPATPESAERLIQILQPGPLTTIQDLGRAGLAHLGVPRSGAADQRSLRLANRLAGNDESAACLEITLGRLALRFDTDAVVALAGAPAPVRLSAAASGPGEGGDPGGSLASGPPGHETAFAVPAGTVLRLGAPSAGLRSYLAIAGGIDVPPVLGSRSADLLSGLGPPPLRPGEWLRVGRPRSRSEKDEHRRPGSGKPAAPVPTGPPGPAGTTMPAGTTVLRAIAGPRDDWFAADALAVLAGGSYQVSPVSNRTGLRLTGPPLRRARTAELPSEGIVAGSLQVSHDGQPILLLADHPTTGGYPVIAVVVSADLGRAAQLRPGQQVRFEVSRPPEFHDRC